MDTRRMKEVMGEFSHEERNEIYGCFVKEEKKKEQELKSAFYRQLRAICTNPFLALEKSHSYHVDQRLKCIEALSDFIEEFYESAERGKQDNKAYRKESMKRTADSFALMGMLHGKEFPEKEKIRVNRDDSDSAPLCLNYLFYTGLVLSIPDKLESQIEIRAEYRIPISELSVVYFVDFAIFRKNDNKLLYIIECDEKYHESEEQKVKDKNREDAIKFLFPNCKFHRIPEDEIYVMKSPDVSAIKRAKQFWDQVEKEWEIGLKSEVKSELGKEASCAKGFFKRLSFLK